MDDEPTNCVVMNRLPKTSAQLWHAGESSVLLRNSPTRHCWQLPSVSVPKPLWHGGGGSGGSEGGGGDAAIVVKEARKEHHEHSHRFFVFHKSL